MPQARAIVSSDGVRPGVNDTGAAIAAHLILRLDPANGVDRIRLATAATQALYGVSMQIIPDAGSGDVQTEKKAVVLAGAAVAIGDTVVADATSRAIASTADNQFILGTAITLALAAGDEIEVELAPPGTQRGT